MSRHSHTFPTSLSFRRGDGWVLAGIVLLAIAIGAVFLFPRSQNGVTVEIRQNGILVCALPLEEDRTVTVDGDYSNCIVIRGGAVWVEDATCPGADCVHSGKISAVGRSIVCLPNRVEIRLVGSTPGDVDMVVG